MQVGTAEVVRIEAGACMPYAWHQAPELGAAATRQLHLQGASASSSSSSSRERTAAVDAWSHPVDVLSTGAGMPCQIVWPGGLTGLIAVSAKQVTALSAS